MRTPLVVSIPHRLGKDEAVRRLRTTTASGDRFADRLKAAHSREVLAKRIIESAQRGERDSIRLCDDALVYLEEQSADGRRGVSAR